MPELKPLQIIEVGKPGVTFEREKNGNIIYPLAYMADLKWKYGTEATSESGGYSSPPLHSIGESINPLKDEGIDDLTYDSIKRLEQDQMQKARESENPDLLFRFEPPTDLPDRYYSAPRTSDFNSGFSFQRITRNSAILTMTITTINKDIALMFGENRELRMSIASAMTQDEYFDYYGDYETIAQYWGLYGVNAEVRLCKPGVSAREEDVYIPINGLYIPINNSKEIGIYFDIKSHATETMGDYKLTSIRCVHLQTVVKIKHRSDFPDEEYYE